MFEIIVTNTGYVRDIAPDRVSALRLADHLTYQDRVLHTIRPSKEVVFDQEVH